MGCNARRRRRRHGRLYFILRAFNTANIIPGTISVTTSFVAVYLTFRRSPYFALAYAANDVVLIVLVARRGGRHFLPFGHHLFCHVPRKRFIRLSQLAQNEGAAKRRGRTLILQHMCKNCGVFENV